MNPVVLIIDDNEGVRTALSMLFSVHDIASVTAGSVDEGLHALQNQPIGLVIQDMNFSDDTTSGKEGVRLFHTIRQLQPDLPIILLTAWTHLETAVDLVRAGAADYLGKPWDNDKIVATARNLLELGEATALQRKESQSRKAERECMREAHDLCSIVFESAAMQELLAIALKVAPADVAVLVSGPNGVGKEKIADIVQANSGVREGPYIRVNVGALPQDLMEAELFGAEAGAFTGAVKAREGRFEAADKGTLFLDEIGNLSLDGQAKLLRVLQTGEYQRVGSSTTRRAVVRVISATNVDLRAEVAAGRFREDLYYRLNVIELQVPALHDRPDDILPLAYYFLSAEKFFDPPAETALLRHDWPGNVRELQNTVKRAALMATDNILFADDLQLPAPKLPQNLYNANAAEPDAEAIRTALRQAHSVVARAARALGMSRQALYRRMDKFGIEK
jgi:DNA-binding NtrC family response regulator